MNNIDLVYNTISSEWENSRKDMPVNQAVVDFVRTIPPNSKILDVGCGTGYPISDYLSSKGFKVTGIDISNKMIERANSLKLENAEFYTSGLLEYESSDLFDAVIAFDSLWHIPFKRQEEIYRKLSYLLKKDGVLLFTHGKNESELTNKMFGKEVYFSSLSKKKVHKLLYLNHFQLLASIEDYKEETTGHRELFIIAKKQ